MEILESAQQALRLKKRFAIFAFMQNLKKFLPIILCLVTIFALFVVFRISMNSEEVVSNSENGYWLILHRKSNTEELFFGIPGDRNQSEAIKTFKVKTGMQGQRPTPLPSLLGREYWLIVDSWEETVDQETKPYFLKLDIEAPSEWPYGPVPYEECNGQCDWVKPGYFGLHGVGGDPSKLSDLDPGSSGCIRHSDEDITYLYNLLKPQEEEIRYYVEDN